MDLEEHIYHDTFPVVSVVAWGTGVMLMGTDSPFWFDVWVYQILPGLVGSPCLTKVNLICISGRGPWSMALFFPGKIYHSAFPYDPSSSICILYWFHPSFLELASQGLLFLPLSPCHISFYITPLHVSCHLGKAGWFGNHLPFVFLFFEFDSQREGFDPVFVLSLVTLIMSISFSETFCSISLAFIHSIKFFVYLQEW